MTTMIFKGHNNSVAHAPTATVPFWHFMCSCGKPVKPDQAWWDGKRQLHFTCLPKEAK